MLEVILAALVAGFVSAVITLWLREKDRPQTFWVIEKLLITTPTFPKWGIQEALASEPPVASFTASNAGDAAAYSVSIEGTGCDPLFLVNDTTDPRGGWLTRKRPRIERGEEISIVIRPLHGVEFRQELATVRLVWLREPVRHLRYEAQLFDVADPEALQLPQRWVPPFQDR